MTALLLLLKATVLIGLVAIAHQLVGARMSAATRHLLWTLTIVGLLVLPGAMASVGYPKLPMELLIDLRNHGITPDYVQELAAVGYTRISTDELLTLRNHGINAEYVRDLNAVGYSRLRADELVKLRNHGVTQEQVARANQRAGTTLSVDALTALASRGWREAAINQFPPGGV